MSEASAALEFEKRGAAARPHFRAVGDPGRAEHQSALDRGSRRLRHLRGGGQFCVEAFFFRTYQNWGNRAYFPRADAALGPEEVLDAFLAQFYLERPAPRLVLLSHADPERRARSKKS